jgi:hypothetical protein
LIGNANNELGGDVSDIVGSLRQLLYSTLFFKNRAHAGMAAKVVIINHVTITQYYL